MWSKGICWIDDCRIPFVDQKDSDKACKSDLDLGEYKSLWLFTEKKHKRTGGNTQGRFPANILVSDDMLNDGVISNSTVGKGESTKSSLDRTDLGYGYKKIDNAPGLGGYGDKGTNSRYYDIDKWFDKIINYE